MNASEALDSYRKADAVFIVCQNNAKRILEIAALNDEAARVTGYQNEEIVGRPLSLILPERINSLIDEFVEYENDKTDLMGVLTKVRQFAIRKNDGKEAEFKLRIVCGESMDNNPWFHLVLVDEQRVRDANAFRAIIKENFKGHEVLDTRTGLPNRLSLIKDIELITYYVRDKGITASFAVADINNYEQLHEKYGEEICNGMQRHISEVFRQKMRTEDTIGTLSERTLGVVLVGASQEEARMVLNRLRWAISVSPFQCDGQEVAAQVNLCFTQIDGKVSNLELLQKCEQHMIDQRATAANSLQLVVARERRGEVAVDRRKQNIPVAVERRSGGERRSKP
ncbi:MAG TPA: diguanylate cyclase [Rickettsiales bacterium]|nr:diguanylate cyclase [Rickettsiales bacterium]